MKKMILPLALILALMAGCGQGPAKPNPTEAPAPTAAPTAEPTVGPTAAPTAEPTAEPTAAPASADAQGQFTQEELLAAMEGARDFYRTWFYDRSSVIDPAYADSVAYPAFDGNGGQDAYPASAPGIETYEQLRTAACCHFHAPAVDELLTEIGAKDVDGRLNVVKSDGLGGVDYSSTLTVTRDGDGYVFDLHYALSAEPDFAFGATVDYTFQDGQWAFAGDTYSLHDFFSVLLYTADLTVSCTLE